MRNTFFSNTYNCLLDRTCKKSWRNMAVLTETTVQGTAGGKGKRKEYKRSLFVNINK